MTGSLATSASSEEIQPNKHDFDGLSKYLTSGQTNKIIHAVNILLEASHDHEENYTLGRGGEKVVDSIVVAFERCIGWSNGKQNPSLSSPIPLKTKNDEESGYRENILGKKRKRVCNQSNRDLEKDYKDLINRAWEKNKEIDSFTDIDNQIEESEQERIKKWHQYCRMKFSTSTTASQSCLYLSESQHRLIEALIMVVRNLSFVASNARNLSYSIGILRMLGGCLQSWRTLSKFSNLNSTVHSNEMDPSNSNACLHSIQTLINLSPFILISGSKVFSDLLLLDDNSGDTNNNDTTPPKQMKTKMISSHTSSTSSEKLPLAYKLGLGGMLIAKRLDATRVDEDLSSKIPSILIRTLVWSHIITMISIFPHILDCIIQNKNRAIVLSALEFLKEIMEHQDNLVLFQNVPDDLLQRLVDLLYVPRLGPDSLEYLDPVTNMVSRVTTLKLANGYDATIDFELRDRAADLLDRITALSPELKRRVGVSYMPRIFDYLICMLGTTVGRGDARQLAGGVLANIAMIRDNKTYGITYVEAKLLDLAAKDANVANVVCNSLLN